MEKLKELNLNHNSGPTLLVVDDSENFIKKNPILYDFERLAQHNGLRYFLFEFDHIHPNKVADSLPDYKCIIATISKSVIDNFVIESSEHAKNTIFSIFNDSLYGLTDDEAAGLYDAYVVGIQHVSEILLSHNIWRC